MPERNRGIPRFGTLGDVQAFLERFLPVTGADAWQEVGATGAPAFTNGWSNLDTIRSSAGLLREANGMVQLKGVVRNVAGAAAGAVFTLPPGARPPKEEWFHIWGSGGVSKVEVLADGRVYHPFAVGAGYQLALSVIRFRAANA